VNYFEKAEWIRASGYTRRYHGWRILLEDQVGSHERNVAKLLVLLWPDAPKEAILYALGHDDAEWIVGDMPAPAKRRLPNYTLVGRDGVVYGTESFREAFGKMEDKVLAEVGLSLPDVPVEWLHRIKLCDSLDGMLYCLQELSMGNRQIITCFDAFASYVSDLLIKESHSPAIEVYNRAREAFKELVI